MITLLKTIHSYGKILRLWLGNKTIKAEDYSKDYDQVAPTYERWLSLMGKHTRGLLSAAGPFSGKTARILDFCCGSGYITEQLLKLYSGEDRWTILGCDISPEMIKVAHSRVQDKRATFLVREGSQFLSHCSEVFDVVFCGWALVYFNPSGIIRELAKVLKPGGRAAVILNARGTLQGIENCFVEIMKENPDSFNRVMDIRFSLPSGEDELKRWFCRAGFSPLETGTGEEFAEFSGADALLDWLQQTGAIAGTSGILEDKAFARQALIARIAAGFGKAGQYTVNHKFVYGIFEKKGGQR